ncbi:pitrilysin family protein [Synechococcus sp. PCC 7336]|uniref:M16 family metallopeptidase n=1 Tax=Synechococcus sp. PCC 7336 TaxID=195250 RepID=UPI000349DDEC|nr:pitrilysin family protein [Synechococcus sp. PCC 7336]
MNPTIHRSQFSNGIVLLAIENPAVDIVSARLYWSGGALAETARQAGLSHLVAAVLTKGTEGRTALDIAECVESAGALFGSESTADYFALSLKSVASDFPSLFHLACEIARRPSFPQTEFDRERALVLQSIRAQQERPFTAAFDPLRRALYGNHPYAFAVTGTSDTVAALACADLVAYHRDRLRPDRLVVAIAGRIDPIEAECLVADALGDWLAPASAPELAVNPLPSLEGDRSLVSEQQTQQTIAMLGCRAAPIDNPDWIPLKLACVHLGGGLSSRLFVELREKRGLAYEVSASFAPRRHAAPLIAYLGTAPANAVEAVQGLRDEFDRLVQQPLTADELAIAKRKLLGQYALSKQTNSQLAQLLGWYETLGLGVAYDRHYPEAIAAVDADRLQRVVARYLTQPVLSVAGPAVPVTAIAG